MPPLDRQPGLVESLLSSRGAQKRAIQSVSDFSGKSLPGFITRGAVSSVLPSPASGNPEPGFQFGDLERVVPTFGHGIAGLIQMAIPGGSAGETQFDKLFAGMDRVDRIFGTRPPENFLESLLEIVGGMAVPLPTPPATTAVGKAARLIAEPLLPGQHVRTPAGAAANIAVPFTLTESVAEVLDQAPVGEITEYQSIFDALTGRPKPSPGILEGAVGVDDIQGQAQVDRFQDTILAPPSESILAPNANVDIPDADIDLLAPDNLLSPHTESDRQAKNFSLPIAGGVAAALLLLFGGARVRARAARKRQTGADLTGIRTRGNENTGLGTQAVTEVVNKNEPILNVAKKALDPDEFKAFRDVTITSGTPSGVSNQIKSFLLTGHFPGSDIRSPRIALHLQTLGKLPRELRELYDSAVVARAKLDDLGPGAIWANRVTHADLTARVNAGNANPIVSNLMDESNEIYSTALRYAREQGIIDDKLFASMKQSNPNFVPLGIDFENRMSLKKLFGKTESVATDEEFKHFLSRKGDVDPGELIPPSVAMEQYFTRLIQFSRQNAIRRSFFDGIEQSGKFANSIKKVKSGNGPNIVAVRRGGVDEFWRVDDDYLRTSLQFMAPQVRPILNATRRLAQQAATGKVLAPEFLPVSWAYEVTTIPGLRPAGTRTGVGGEILSALGVPPLEVGIGKQKFGIDPTIILSPITGTARAGFAQMVREMGVNIEVSLRTGGIIPDMIGEQNSKALAKIMQDAYEGSVVNLFERSGGGGAPLIEALEFGGPKTLLPKIAPAMSRAMNRSGMPQVQQNAVVRFLSGFMDNGHNAFRIQHFASNVRGVSRTDERALTAAAAGSRTSSGDVGQVGQSGITSAIPYANVFTQVVAQHVRQFKNNPTQLFGTMAATSFAGLGALLVQFANNGNARNTYWNEMTPAQRAAFIPVFDQEGKIIARFPLAHEQRLQWSPFIESVGTVFGFRNGGATFENAETMQAMLTEMFTNFDVNNFNDPVAEEALKKGLESAALQAIPDVIPPALGVAAGALGITQDVAPGRFGVSTPPTERLTGEGVARVGDTHVTARVERIVTELLSASARPILDGVIAFERTGQAVNKEEGLAKTLLTQAEAAAIEFTAGKVGRLPFGPLLGIDFPTSTATPEFTALVRKRDKLREAVSKSTVQAFAPGVGTRGAGPETGFEPFEATGQLGDLFDTVALADNYLSKIWGGQLADLRRQRDALNANIFLQGQPGLRRRRLNELTLEIQELNREAFDFVLELEDTVGLQIGKTFRFEDFDSKFEEELRGTPQ